MGKILSATTVQATAYLTELGRQYLFNGVEKSRYVTALDGSTIDLLKIERFSLGDPDVNYNIPFQLASGDVPDLSGENEGSLKGAKGRTLSNIISPGKTHYPKEDITKLIYDTTHGDINIDLKQELTTLKTVYTQQLLTYVNGVLVQDGLYNVTPTSYGQNKAKGGELVINIKTPTTTYSNGFGYRLRIFYPTIGSNFDKMTFQFEQGEAKITTPSIQTLTTTQNGVPERGTENGFTSLLPKEKLGPEDSLLLNQPVLTTVPTSNVNLVITWKSMASFTNDLKNALIAFVNTTRENVRVSTSPNGRKKTIQFYFSGTATKSIIPGEIGEFALTISYPPTKV